MNDKQTENQAYKDKSNGSEISRRGFLSSAALATVAGTLAVNGAMAKDRQQANDRSKSDPGPSNRPLDTQNPDSEWPPDTGSKSWFETLNTRSLSPISAPTNVAGRAR
jgi:hypothetical protein